MAKRLVVCCDGTWNSPDQNKNHVSCPTNVTRFALAIAAQNKDGIDQLVYYHKGVGTGKFDRLRGGAFGRGLTKNIKDAYSFLIENYQFGDELFFFGFSRGAYTARSTVGLIRNSGLPRREYIHKLDDAYELYRRRDDDSHPNAVQLFRKSFAYADETRIRFIGVWDTVGSLGIPKIGLGIVNALLKHRWSFHDVQLSRSVDCEFQALAIDEQRKPFAPAIWQQQPGSVGQLLEQVWFSEVHSNVGGGYPETGLSDITLRWMVDKAKGCGLAFDEQYLKEKLKPDPLAKIMDSMTCFYRLFGRYTRPIGESDKSERAAGTAVKRTQLFLTISQKICKSFWPRAAVSLTCRAIKLKTAKTTWCSRPLIRRIDGVTVNSNGAACVV
jgi:uncharacterized protein (DUF2235 family)